MRKTGVHYFIYLNFSLYIVGRPWPWPWSVGLECSGLANITVI